MIEERYKGPNRRHRTGTAGIDGFIERAVREKVPFGSMSLREDGNEEQIQCLEQTVRRRFTELFPFEKPPNAIRE